MDPLFLRAIVDEVAGVGGIACSGDFVNVELEGFTQFPRVNPVCVAALSLAAEAVVDGSRIGEAHCGMKHGRRVPDGENGTAFVVADVLDAAVSARRLARVPVRP